MGLCLLLAMSPGPSGPVRSSEVPCMHTIADFAYLAHSELSNSELLRLNFEIDPDMIEMDTPIHQRLALACISRFFFAKYGGYFRKDFFREIHEIWHLLGEIN